MDSKPIETSEKYIEVSAVARILGVSTTTIYNKLAGEWADHKHKIRGITMVDLCVLTAEQQEKAREILREREFEGLKDPLKEPENSFKLFETTFETALKDQIETLKRENERMERLLEDANRRIGEKDATITSLSERLADLTERALKTTEQAQFLTAQAQTAAAALPEPEAEEEPVDRGWFGIPKRKKKK